MGLFVHLVVFVFAALIFSPEVASQEVILLRCAKTLPQKGVLIWESLYFTTLTEKYNYNEDKFVHAQGDNYKFTSYTMLGYGILDSLELLVQLPVHYKKLTVAGGVDESTGFGDMSLQARLMVYRGKNSLPSANVGFLVRLPSGNDQRTPALGDGTIDYGFSSVVTWKKRFFEGHVKVGYILNGTTSTGWNLGDQFLYMVKGDFTVLSGNYIAMKQLTLMAGVNGNMKFHDRDNNGEQVENSYIYRPLNIAVMVRWKPVKGFCIRPRINFPVVLLASGGRTGPALYILDLAYSF